MSGVRCPVFGVRCSVFGTRYSQLRVRLLALVVTVAIGGACAGARPVISASEPSLQRRSDVVQTARTLDDALVAAGAYPHIQPRCLYYDLESAGHSDYSFAVRFNQAKCGGDSPSNLLDRFSVTDGRVLWSDTADGGTLKALGELLKSRSRLEPQHVALSGSLERSPRRGNPIWAANGLPLNVECDDAGGRGQGISSPDRRITLQFRCHERQRISVRVTRASGGIDDSPVAVEGDVLWRPQEVLWSPDSQRFVVNGGSSAYSGFTFVVFDITARVITRDITTPAQRDMFDRFPPCKAAFVIPQDCATVPGYANMSAIGWTRNSSAVLIFAEVPCSSTYGGIMCQVMGYEVDATTGRILQTVTARQMKSRWQKYMAWPMRIPDPPKYHNSE